MQRYGYSSGYEALRVIEAPITQLTCYGLLCEFGIRGVNGLESYPIQHKLTDRQGGGLPVFIKKPIIKIDGFQSSAMLSDACSTNRRPP